MVHGMHPAVIKDIEFALDNLARRIDIGAKKYDPIYDVIGQIFLCYLLGPYL